MTLPGPHTAALVAVAAVACLLIARPLLRPALLVVRLAVGAIVGFPVLLALNRAGTFMHYHIAVNAFTATTVGALGLPGLVAVIAIQRIAEA